MQKRLPEASSVRDKTPQGAFFVIIITQGYSTMHVNKAKKQEGSVDKTVVLQYHGHNGLLLEELSVPRIGLFMYDLINCILEET